jgi:hypothetical protein
MDTLARPGGDVTGLAKSHPLILNQSSRTLSSDQSTAEQENKHDSKHNSDANKS